MRRVATFIVAFGLIIAGIGASAGGRPWPGPPAAAPARLAGWVAQGGGATKAVHYAGYAVRVPADWPVYRLDRDPTRCVRYDRHAVYLGRPGPDQVCPAHLVGRVATVSLQAPPAGRPGSAGPGPGRLAALPAVGNLPLAGVPVRADPPGHVLYATARHPGLAISATYGSDDAAALKIIQSVRRTSPAPAGAAQQARQQARQPARPRVEQAVATAARSGLARGGTVAATATPTAGGGRAGSSGGRVVGKGFDTCAAPSLALMRAWRHAFSYAGIYIGGAEAGCGYGNLSASWIRSVTALGWGLIPTYVGPQAPCDKQFTVRIAPSRARAQGQAAAIDAIQDAAALGLGRGTPIYYDMESFNAGNASCRSTVLSFLDGWTRQIHASRYVSGVYSSAATGARALGEATSVYGRTLAKPDALWFAYWDDVSNVDGTPYLSPSWWPGYRRIKQYMGPHTRKVNGFALNIDGDLIRGPVYR
jgi:Rv2525c-like, glycoside hydrolase-like domain